MNSSEQTLNNVEYLTVADYAQRFNMSENTVRTRLNRGKLKKVLREIDGRETITIPVDTTVDHSITPEEQFETVQGTVVNNPESSPEQSVEWLKFVHATMERHEQLIRENERYKLLTDQRTQTAEQFEVQNKQLTETIHELQARIKELESQQETNNSKEQSKPWWQVW